jgi:hypothetical protein
MGDAHAQTEWKTAPESHVASVSVSIAPAMATFGFDWGTGKVALAGATPTSALTPKVAAKTAAKSFLCMKITPLVGTGFIPN